MTETVSAILHPVRGRFLRCLCVVHVSLLLAGSTMSSAQEVRLITADSLVHLLHNSEKPLMVNFWATWCKPCLDEIPYLLEAHRRHPEQFDLLFVSVDFRSQQAAVSKTVKRLGMDGLTVHLLAQGNWIDRIDPNWSGAIPFTLLRYNQKAAYFYDAFHSTDQVVEFVNTALKTN